MCDNAAYIKSYLCAHDKALWLKYMYALLRYGILKGNFAFKPDIFALYKYRYDEHLSHKDDRVWQAFTQSAKGSFHPHALPIGYFQNLTYLQGLDSILHKEFCLKTPLTAQNQALKAYIHSLPQSAFLHIRLGDYLEGGTFVRLGSAYYNQAVQILKKHLGKAYIFVFSNNIPWCERNAHKYIDFSGLKVEFVKHNDEGNAAQELELMRACKHGIMANSTFSWWAAYLNDNPHKIVCMPKYFFNDITRIPQSQMIAKQNYILLDHTWAEI